MMMAQRRRNKASSSDAKKRAIIAGAAAYKTQVSNLQNQVQRSKQISNINFKFNFNCFSDADCLDYLGLEKKIYLERCMR